MHVSSTTATTPYQPTAPAARTQAAPTVDLPHDHDADDRGMIAGLGLGTKVDLRA